MFYMDAWKGRNEADILVKYLLRITLWGLRRTLVSPSNEFSIAYAGVKYILHRKKY